MMPKITMQEFLSSNGPLARYREYLENQVIRKVKQANATGGGALSAMSQMTKQIVNQSYQVKSGGVDHYA